MKIKFGNGIGRKIVAYTLVGTIASTAAISIGERYEDYSEDKIFSNDLLYGFYYDEDVKKNKQDILDRLSSGSKEKVKVNQKIK